MDSKISANAPSLLDILNKTAQYFQKHGFTHPRLEAECLIAAAMGCKRLDLYLNFEKPLPEPLVDQLRLWVQRRTEREPLQYIVGSVDFMSLKLKADARALIPRPETEELCEWLIKNCAQCPPGHILDLGTGSGAIALALATHFPKAQVTAVDISQKALSLAKENEALLSLQGPPIKWVQGSWFEPLVQYSQFNLIVSNPPYLTDREWASAQAEVKDYEPKNALVAPIDGLKDLQVILKEAQKYLASDGMLLLETGISHHLELSELAGQLGYARMESRQDMSGRDRFFIAWQ